MTILKFALGRGKILVTRAVVGRIMQSILWLLLVFHIFVLIFESSHADSHSKWKRRNLNSHKNVIDEMTPGQYSHLQEQIKYNRIPLRHARPRFTKMDMVVSKYTENGGSFGKREDPDQGTHSDAAATTREKPNAEYLESKLKSSQRVHSREQYFEDGLVVEDTIDNASTYPSASQMQVSDENFLLKQNECNRRREECARTESE